MNKPNFLTNRIFETLIFVSLAVMTYLVLVFGIILPFFTKPSTYKEDKRILLERFAYHKLNDLTITNTWSHTNSDGCDFKCRIKEIFGSEDVYIGENLYQGDCNLEKAYREWYGDPRYEAVLKERYDYLVILSEEFKPGQCYIVYNIMRF